MPFSASGADVEVYIGNAETLVTVTQQDANGNERHAENLTITNTPNIERLALLGTESKEANVNNLMRQVSIPFLAGTATDLLDTIADRMDLWLVILGTDSPATHTSIPMAFGGLPYSNPTNNSQRRPGEFAQRDVGLVGRPVTGKPRVQQFNMIGSEEEDFTPINDTDRLLAVITAHADTPQVLKLTDGTKDISADLTVSGTGIHELTLESGEVWSSATKVLYAGSTQNTCSVYFVAGPTQTKGDG